MNYETIKKNFLRGLWNATMVQVALRKGVLSVDQFKEIMQLGVFNARITAAQYQALVGEAYSAE